MMANEVGGIVARSSRQAGLALLIVGSLISPVGAGSREEADVSVADFFDGLRAWELHEEPTAAAIWLRAAQFGDARAMQRVAELYEKGKVLPQDAALAYFWYFQAARHGDGQAKAAADRVRSQLTARDISNVKESVADWRPQSLTAAPIEKKLSTGDLFAALDGREIQDFKEALHTADPNSANESGVPILFLAIATQEKDFVKALLDKRASPNVELQNGMTPLHVAAGIGDLGIVEILIGAGASAAVQDQNGVWPLDLAERMKFSNVADRLKSQLDKDTIEFKKFLEEQEYISPNKFFDSAARQTAVRMFQDGRSYLKSTGNINLETLQASKNEIADINLLFSYVLVYTYQEGGQWYLDSASEDNQTAKGARDSIPGACRVSGRSNCKIHVVPPGGCLAIAKTAVAAPYRVSGVTLSRKDASADALAQCTAYTSTGCSIAWEICVDAQSGIRRSINSPVESIHRITRP